MSTLIDKKVYILYVIEMIEVFAFIAGVAIALVIYDMTARVKAQKDLTDTLSKIREAHNAQALSLANMQDAVNRHEMMLGGRPKSVATVK